MEQTAERSEVVVEVLGGRVEVLDELQRIYRRDGELKVETLCVESRRKESPLYVTPKDAEQAGREYLMRKLVGRFFIEVVKDDAVLKQRRWVSVEKGDGRAYMASEEVARDQTFREAYRMRLVEQMKQLKNSLRNFDEFCGIADLIEEVIEA